MLAQLFVQQTFIIYCVLGSVLGVGIIKVLFLALEELMTLRKRQTGKRHFALPIAKDESRDL